MTVATDAKSKSSTAPIVAWRQPVEREVMKERDVTNHVLLFVFIHIKMCIYI